MQFAVVGRHRCPKSLQIKILQMVLLSGSNFLKRNRPDPVSHQHVRDRSLNVGNCHYGVRKLVTGSIAIEGPVEGLPEFFDAGLLFFLPGAGGGKSHPQPADVEQVLTHVIPIAAEHPDCPVFLAVTDKASDVDHVVAEIREDPGRPECSRSHEERNAVPAELREVIFVIVQRKILPGDRHGIVRKDREVDVRLVRGHVCPEEDLLSFMAGRFMTRSM